jgi:hypothetical protein
MAAGALPADLDEVRRLIAQNLDVVTDERDRR